MISLKLLVNSVSGGNIQTKKSAMQQLRQILLTRLAEILEQAERTIDDLPESLARSRVQHIRGLTKQLAFTVQEQLPDAHLRDSDKRLSSTSSS